MLALTSGENPSRFSLIAWAILAPLHKARCCVIPLSMAFAQISATLHHSEISHVKFIIEGYDGLGIVTTIDPHAATISITYPQEREHTLIGLMESFLEKGIVKEVTRQ